MNNRKYSKDLFKMLYENVLEYGQEEKIRSYIKDLFLSKANLTHEAAREYALNDLKIDYKRFDEIVYNLYHELLMNIGKHNHVPDEEFDQEQLKMGINVELEHTNCPIIAKNIAKDHLSEPGLEKSYYSKLKKMEK